MAGRPRATDDGIDMFGDKRLFHATLVLGAGSLVVFAAAETGSAWQVGAWFAPQVVALVLWTMRTGSSPESIRGPLVLLLAGLFTYFGAGFVWYVWPMTVGTALPFPSSVDGLYFTAYGIFAVFLLRVLRRYRSDPVSNRIALVDAAMVTTAASAALWVGLIEPQLGASLPDLTVVVAVLYPVFTLLLFGLAARMAISLRLTGSAPALLMLAWIGCEVAADVFYSFQGATGTFYYDGPLMLLWIASYTALAGLAAHPGAEEFLRGATKGRQRSRSSVAPVESATRRRLRLAVLLAAALFPLPLHSVYDDNSPALLVASAATFLLVTYRASLLAGDLGKQRQLAEELDGAVQRLRSQRDELARFAAIVDATDDAVITSTPAGRVIAWNPGAERLYGYPAEEAIGSMLRTLIHQDGEPHAPGDVLDLVEQQGHASFESIDLRKDGSTVQVSVTVSRILDEAGNVVACVGIARDISDRKTREAEMQQESKLEALGRLSAGLAHEINSPIQFVGDNARFLEEAYHELIGAVNVYRELLDTANPIGWSERQERVRQAEATIDFEYLQKEIPSAVEQTLEGIERVSTIVRAMKMFSHPGHKEQVPANLNEALAATITVTRHQVSSVADLRLDLAELPPVRCNIADLNQVFLNLIVNAADAIAETGAPGVIDVSTKAEDEHVVIRISDTGGGIPEDVRSKIFDPFFTTKEVGRGSGQGLPLARGVVHDGHGGTLTVDTRVGVGSTFAVRLPIAGRPVAEPAPAVVG